jgi:sigma-B regulation protein RsbU (phosphoserine phosphatase)
MESGDSSERLRRLEALTDPALVHLDTAELLDELVDRVEGLLEVDTVAVLLLDATGTALIARAARGLEEEVHQGVRLPLGRGFAGRIASTRAPVLLDHVGPDTVLNPILWQKGVRSLLGVPLIADGRLLGVMHVGTMHPRQFDDHDTTMLQLAASRIASALWSQQTAAERSAARMLQQSLVPTRLPAVEGLEFASRFVPAEEVGVGGDWFDAFRLPDGGTGVVMGDVAGAGLRAAIVMGRLRSSLRAYAIESASPGEALERVDRKFAHFEPDELATILYVVVSPELSQLTVASRGHLPPLIATPGRDTAVVDCSPRPPIGAHVPAPAMNVTCELPVGSTVACYTDGLIERHGEPIDVGLERLRRALHAGPPDEVCASVMAQLVGSRPVEDDTALLVFRRTE